MMALKAHAFLSVVLFAVISSLPFAEGVLYGDEQYLDAKGKFWAFYSEGIAVIDPDTCQIETTLTQDHDGNPLPTSWNDGVYMQYDTGKNGDDDLKGYIMISSGVDRSNAVGDAVSDAYTISTTERKVIDSSEVGSRAVHSYAVYPQDEFWVHSDGDGFFYVINLADVSTHSHKVEAKQELPFHGKLLWDEDGSLGDRGFATSTGEQYLFELNLKTKEQVAAYNFANDVSEGCSGLHAIAYSSKNGHVFAECTDGGGILEFDVSGGGTRFVHQHLNATGALYEVPDGSFVVASNKAENVLHVFEPSETGQISSIEFEVQMPGHPSSVSFFKVGGGEADFIACSPLTENLNQNQRSEDGEVLCDAYNGCTGAATADDVAHGVCLHSAEGQLMRVEVTTDDPACLRCADTVNFSDNGDCVCTPECGSCDSNPLYDASSSGVICVDLQEVVAGTTTQGKLISDAGGVTQGRPYGDSPDCTFGGTYRPNKRGGKYDASIANHPTDSIQIINMETQLKHCQVNLPGAPSRVLFAPDSPVVGASDSSGTSMAAIMATSAVSILAVVASLWG